MLKHLCPCCGRHCYLSDPQCERGAEYAATGVIPPHKPHPAGGARDEAKAARKKWYRTLTPSCRLVHTLHRLAAQLPTLPEGEEIPAETEQRCRELLACLQEEDQKDLLMLLEKLSHSFRR